MGFTQKKNPGEVQLSGVSLWLPSLGPSIHLQMQDAITFVAMARMSPCALPIGIHLLPFNRAERDGTSIIPRTDSFHKQKTSPRRQVGTDKEAPNKPTHSRTLKPKRQGADPGPLFFHVPDRPHRFPQGNARASAGRITATAIPTGASFPHTASPSAGNCHGAEPTFDPALLPAADNRPAASRGGPPSRRHPSNATFNTKSCLLATYITHLSAADFCDNRYIYIPQLGHTTQPSTTSEPQN